MDLNQYRLTNYRWIAVYQQQLGKERFDKFVDIVYKWLDDLKPGQIIDLLHNSNITNDNRELMIKITCVYIIDGHSEIEFSNDYRKILKKDETTLDKRRYRVSGRKQPETTTRRNLPKAEPV